MEILSIINKQSSLKVEKRLELEPFRKLEQDWLME